MSNPQAPGEAVRPGPGSPLRAGAMSMLPFLASAIPMGLAGGILGPANGLSGWATLGLAMAVNSGTAQFIGFALIAGHSGALTILLTTLILGLRMLIYSAILVPHVREVPQRWRVLLGFGLIDAVFFVAVERLKKGELTERKHLFFLGASGVMYVTWMLCTLVGMALGSAVPDLADLGLDFPMTAMFVAMLAGSLTNWRVGAAIVTAGLTVVLGHGLPYNLGVVLATVVGATVGTVCEYLEKRRSPENSATETSEESSPGEGDPTTVDNTANDGELPTVDNTANDGELPTVDKTANDGKVPTVDKTANDGKLPTVDKTANDGKLPTVDKTANDGKLPTVDKTANDGEPPTEDKAANADMVNEENVA